MPGYEPFLLCDFHVHTQWSDGKLTVREVVDLYGKTGKFDVIAITDHILMKKDLLARAGRLATLGRRSFGLREGDFEAYLADIRTEARRAFDRYGMLVVAGAEITQNRLRGHKNSHVIALDIKEYISADQRADEILHEIRRQGALSIACHPHHRATRRLEISIGRRHGGGIRHAPVRRHRLARPEGRLFGRGLVADSEDEVHTRRIDGGELAPILASQSLRGYPGLLQEFDGERIDGAFRVAAGAEGAELAAGNRRVIGHRLGQDRSRRIPGTQEQDVQRRAGASGFAHLSESDRGYR